MKDFGKVFDATKTSPPAMADVLVFVDGLFDWFRGFREGGHYIVPSFNGEKPVAKTQVLYWAPMPPSSLVGIRKVLRNFRNR